MMSEAESATLVPQAQPESLQRQCLKFVCSNLEQICVKTTCPSSSIHGMYSRKKFLEKTREMKRNKSILRIFFVLDIILLPFLFFM